MNTKVEISVIIATFNSEKTLPLVLQSLKKQSFQHNKIEILLLDGGSQDATKKIGEKFNCQIILNPRTEPVYAKFLGFQKAKGKYALYLDHDEVLENKDSLDLKVSIMQNDNSIKAVVGTGYKNPSGYPFINAYINEFGDPFSFFIYKLSKDARFFIPTMQKRYAFTSEKTADVFAFTHNQELPLIELCAAGSMIDVEYFKKTFPEITKKPSMIPHIFYLLLKKKAKLAVTKQDALLHYSSETIGKYLTKIRWRIKNNIFHKEQLGSAGFSGRQAYHSKWSKYKKYFFIVYVFTCIFLIGDTINLMVTRQEWKYIAHIPLCIYTAALILYYYCLKILGYKPQLRSYDETKIITSDL